MRIVREELPCHTARVLVLTGQTFDPAKAVVMGVVDEVVEPARVGPRAIEMAATMAAFPAYGRIKAQFRANAIAEITRIVETNDDPMLAGWLPPPGRSRELLRRVNCFAGKRQQECRVILRAHGMSRACPRSHCRAPSAMTDPR